MQQETTDLWVGIAPEDFKEFSNTLKKVEATNIFPVLFAEDDFKQVGENTYAKGNDQVIKVFYESGKWQYQNLKDTKDRGSAVEFIANRWGNEKPKVCQTPAILFLASNVASNYYNSHIKSLKKDFQLQLLLNPPSPKKKRTR